MSRRKHLGTASFVVVLGLLAWWAGRSAAAEAAAGARSQQRSGTAQRASKRAPATHTITIDGTRFDPETLTVDKGDVVVWVNKDPFPHTATSQSGRFDSKTIAADESWRYQTVRTGEFPYICLFHPTMKGLLRVR